MDEDRRSSTTSLFTWLVCGLVGLQFCKRAYDRGDLALRSARSFYSSSVEGAPLAEADSCQRGIADRLGRIQSHRVGRPFFDRCSRRDRIRNFLAGVLFIRHQTNAATRGPNSCPALHYGTCHGARGIRRKTRAESPELIRSCPAPGLPARDSRISPER